MVSEHIPQKKKKIRQIMHPTIVYKCTALLQVLRNTSNFLKASKFIFLKLVYFFTYYILGDAWDYTHSNTTDHNYDRIDRNGMKSPIPSNASMKILVIIFRRVSGNYRCLSQV